MGKIRVIKWRRTVSKRMPTLGTEMLSREDVFRKYLGLPSGVYYLCQTFPIRQPKEGDLHLHLCVFSPRQNTLPVVTKLIFNYFPA